ncbi:MAG TPA: hypothetical protein VLA21_07655, partial [Candidatus Limnocylindria bacterium]|nr:hypothetical protein [Candidatus Limnocylindria bacterium]
MLDVRNQPGMPGSYMDETPPPDAQGPGSWAAQLAALAARLTRVRWKKSGLVVTHSRRVLARMNAIRSRVEEVPSDIIRLVPSAIWVIDNFQMMYREIKKLTFSTSGYSPIPVLRDTGWKGKPRIYAIAQKMVAVTGGYINEENITDMLRAAQESQPLTERELQAIPEMLGLCLLEHILALTGDILDAVDQKARAARFVREKLDAAQDYPDISALLEGEEARRGGIPFHSHVVYTLKGMSLPQDALARYVTRHFRDQWENMGPVELFKEESRQESLMESAIRAPVTSLRALEELSEETLFEELSAVERILRADPDGVYPRMDSASRAMYREEVEKLSIRTGLMETDIALASVRLAEARDPRLTRGGHVGAYLLGKGRRALAASLRGRSVKGKLREPFNLRGAAYFAFLAAASLGLLYALYALLDAHGARPGQAAALLVPGLPIMVGAAVKLANMLFTRAVPARILPAMDYEEGLPDEARTMVVMPVIISGKAQGIAYMDRLHKHFLANRQKNLFFALLADYADADAQHMPGDAALREALIARLDRLNTAHPSPVPRFSLLIRGRRYNPAEGRWMCWERKRGKLEEFNRLLSGEDMAKTSFAEAFTDPELLGSVRYVITLDADSDLVLDNASRLAGIIDHPLNRAVIDPAQGRVSEGYAIIQPQVLNHIAEPGNSFFQRVYAGKSGLANYTMAISDVYQDVFKAGIFVGKGIYDVRAFHRLLGGVIPENRVLSHDLLESCYARTAFAGNAHIVETFPSSFAAYATRQHRRIRGDWQLLPWLVRPGLGGLSRWKILEDLRASLMPAFRLAFLLLCATLFPALWWAGLAVLAIPTALDLLSIGGDVLIHWMRGPRYVLLYRKLLRELGLLAARFGLELVFIPFDAYFAMDAIVRTLYRFAVSKKHFLMWETAEHADRTAENTLGGYLARMWPALPAGAALAAAASLSTMPLAGQAAYALLAAVWAASPLVAYLISLGGRKKGLPAPDGDGMLLDTARRTWRFFRDYATPQNHFLAPDNYQLGRQDPVTAKTSPTNIGLQLLSALAARDLGLETLTSALDFLEPVMDTVYRLPKWNGHLFNWYDTRTLDILSPQYVSTVDSGNFTGYLVALAGGLREMASLELVPQPLLAELEALLRLSGAPAQLSGAYPSCAALEADLLLASLAVMADPRASHTREGADFLRLSGHLRAEIGALGAGDEPLMGLTPASLAEGGSPGAAD